MNPIKRVKIIVQTKLLLSHGLLWQDLPFGEQFFLAGESAKCWKYPKPEHQRGQLSPQCASPGLHDRKWYLVASFNLKTQHNCPMQKKTNGQIEELGPFRLIEPDQSVGESGAESLVRCGPQSAQHHHTNHEPQRQRPTGQLCGIKHHPFHH